MTHFFAKITQIFIIILIIPNLTSGDTLLLQSTTSTRNSGLYDALLPKFENKTGIDVKVVAVGTGQAIRNAKNCDGDLVIVHSKFAEEEFVSSEYGVERFDLMYNDFIIAGPKLDSFKFKKFININNLFQIILKNKLRFVSRGDNSGTHQKEMQLWQHSRLDPIPYSGSWYLEVGAGMGTALNIAAELNAYILADRATWIAFKNKQNLTIVYQNDEILFNQYGVILVNPRKCPNSNYKDASILSKWLRSAEGQQEIMHFKLSGTQLFYPNAK